MDYKRISDKVNANIVRVQKKQTKGLDVKKDRRNDFPRESMDDAKSEKKKGKNCDSLNEIAKDLEVSRKTESINQSQKVADKNIEEIKQENVDEIRTRKFFEDNEELFELIKKINIQKEYLSII